MTMSLESVLMVVRTGILEYAVTYFAETAIMADTVLMFVPLPV